MSGDPKWTLNVTRTESFEFDIQNLSCASCVARVENALGAVAGVASASVNLPTETARVQGSTSAPELARALDIAGYPARGRSVRLAISGMTCASCVGRVEKSLTDLAVTLSARVNLADSSAHVVTLGRGDADLIQAVADAGYDARLAATDDIDHAALHAAHLGRMTLLSALFALPVFGAEMGGHLYPPLHHFLAQTLGLPALWTMEFLLTTLVMAIPGRQFFVIGFPALWRGRPEMNSLVALGTLAAWGYSTISLFAPSLLPEASRVVYFESAAVIVTLVLLGRWLEARAKGRAGQAIAALLDLQPPLALVDRPDGPTEVPVGDIATGDMIRLRPGERVAVDGVVVAGSSFVDAAMVTGEPTPVEVGPGTDIVGGTVNGTGALTYRATAVGADTVLARIVAMVETAQATRLPVEALVNRVTSVFVPIVIGIAALTVLGWLVLAPTPALSQALVAGVSVLIIACPCAMGLATPVSIIVGTGRAASLGVLFRRGDALQRLAAVRVVAFDKTGTLTEGRPAMTDLVMADGQDADPTLALVAAVETSSEHPLAQALVAAAKDRDLTLPRTEAVTAIPGLGLRGQAGGHAVLIGSGRLMHHEKLDPGPLVARAEVLATEAKTPLFIAIDGQVAALVAVADPIKSTTSAALDALRAAGLEVAMITGDNATTAQAIADRLSIDHVVAGVLPEGKVAALEKLRATQGALAFVGDGINDAPALAEAEVGIALGTGTDVAIEAADIVLMSGSPVGVARAYDISRKTMANIRQNLGWAFGYNAALIPVAAFGLLSPMLAAGAMAASSVLVLGNALRLRWAGGKDDR